MGNIKLIRNFETENYLEIVLVSAVSSILLIRFFLHVTNYPQLGGGGFHIAHMLWGGLLMLAAIVLLLSFLNRGIQHLAALLGGVGLGFFIDELGKFVTSDNDYFFEPTVSMIYIFFIIFYLITRFIQKQHVLSKDEYLANAFEFVRSAVDDKTNPQNKRRALEILEKCDKNDPTVRFLYSILEDIKESDRVKQSVFAKMDLTVHNLYANLLEKRLVTQIIIVFFIFHSLVNLYRVIDVLSLFFRLNDFSLSFTDWGELLSLLLSTLLVVIGILRMGFSAVSGYKFFRWAVLISIFFTQFFDFYKTQLSAFIILLYNVFILAVLHFILHKEQNRVIFAKE